jgi:DNA-binding response OmpR family regulator
MACLLTRPGDAFSPRYLAKRITGQDLDQWQAASIIRPIIFRLRRKLLMSPHLSCSIRTARRAGYRLSIEETSGEPQNYWNELRAILENSETDLSRAQP